MYCIVATIAKIIARGRIESLNMSLPSLFERPGPGASPGSGRSYGVVPTISIGLVVVFDAGFWIF